MSMALFLGEDVLFCSVRDILGRGVGYGGWSLLVKRVGLVGLMFGLGWERFGLALVNG